MRENLPNKSSVIFNISLISNNDLFFPFDKDGRFFKKFSIPKPQRNLMPPPSCKNPLRNKRLLGTVVSISRSLSIKFLDPLVNSQNFSIFFHNVYVSDNSQFDLSPNLKPAEIERNWLREDSMVARGQVEVLLLDREVQTL